MINTNSIWTSINEYLALKTEKKPAKQKVEVEDRPEIIKDNDQIQENIEVSIDNEIPVVEVVEKKYSGKQNKIIQGNIIVEGISDDILNSIKILPYLRLTGGNFWILDGINFDTHISVLPEIFYIVSKLIPNPWIHEQFTNKDNNSNLLLNINSDRILAYTSGQYADIYKDKFITNDRLLINREDLNVKKHIVIDNWMTFLTMKSKKDKSKSKSKSNEDMNNDEEPIIEGDHNKLTKLFEADIMRNIAKIDLSFEIDEVITKKVSKKIKKIDNVIINKPIIISENDAPNKYPIYFNIARISPTDIYKQFVIGEL